MSLTDGLLILALALLVAAIVYLHLLLREAKRILKGLGYLQDTIRSRRS